MVLEQNLPPIDLGQHILRYIVEILVHAHNFPHLLQGVADFFQTVHFFQANPSHEQCGRSLQLPGAGVESCEHARGFLRYILFLNSCVQEEILQPFFKF